MDFGDQRQESVNALVAQPLSDDSFVTGAGMYRIPALNTGRNSRRHIRELPRLVAGTHSFAL